MRAKTVLILLTVLVLLSLAGCEKAECKKDADCKKAHFTSKCEQKKCVHTPVPNECGNKECEEGTGENKCTCAEDCGKCEGKQGKWLELHCEGKNCIATPAKASPVKIAKEATSAGDKFKITLETTTPVNANQEGITLDLDLTTPSKNTVEHRITKIELNGKTKDGKSMMLTEKTLDRGLWTETSIKEKLYIKLPEKTELELKEIEAKISYTYTLLTGTKREQKTGTIQAKVQTTVVAVTPQEERTCPKNCDDANEGTQDTCSQATDYFCTNEPIPGKCGNYLCETGENSCSCALDCGPCAKTTAYLQSSCVQQQCITTVKQSVTTTPVNILDDRNMGAVHLQNNYQLNNPFSTAKDKIKLDFKLFNIQEEVTGVVIDTVHVLEGEQEMAVQQTATGLGAPGATATVEISLPKQAVQESEKTLTLKVWYSYTQRGESKKASYTKSLPRTVILSPDQ